MASISSLGHRQFEKASNPTEVPLIVIVGPTASGKTALAIKLAKKYRGEIICADSRTVYREMNIGTAKPTSDEQHAVPHWGIDLVDPNQRYTAADFKHYAQEKIKEIRQRGATPFIVGGTGLYTDGVVFDYQFGPQANNARRHELEQLSVEKLQEYCNINNIRLPQNKTNRRHLVRAIEQNGDTPTKRNKPIKNCIIVGIATDKTTLRTRIEQRAEHLFDRGVVEEAKMLGQKYGWNSEAMTGNIYPLLHSYLEGKCTLTEVKQRFITLDWRLAKRQLTWFRRNPYIQWHELSDAEQYLSSVLSEHKS